jgi:hypothetical protein
MNKRLFGAGFSFGIIVGGLAICAASFLVFVFFVSTVKRSSWSFLKYSDQRYYAPKDENGLGFIGKVNAMLSDAVHEADGNNRPGLEDYRRLSFHNPADSGAFLPEDQVRLIGFVPKNAEDSAFYINSDFINAIERQKRALGQRFFKIDFKRDGRSVRISRIRIEPSLYKVALRDEGWRGVVRFSDPYGKLDSSIRYLVSGKSAIPLFTSNVTPEEFRNHLFLTTNDTASSRAAFRDPSQDWFSDSLRNRPIRIRYGGTGFVDFLNSRWGLRLAPFNVEMKVTVAGKDGPKTVWTHSDTTVEIDPGPLSDLVRLEIKENTTGIWHYAYISRVSPFTIGSKPTQGGGKLRRVRMDTAALDLFGQQLVSQLESSMPPNSKDSITLSLNVILSKYLERKLREQVRRLAIPTHGSSKNAIQMSLCLIDIATGEVIAAPYHSSEFPADISEIVPYQRNFNLVGHRVGSALKPLLTLPAYLKFPSLKDFELTSSGAPGCTEENCVLLGYQTGRYGVGPKAGHFWNVPMNRARFLAESHNNYPIATVLLGLTEPQTAAYDILSRPIPDNRSLNALRDLNGIETTRIIWPDSLPHFESSSLVAIISNLYGVPIARGRSARDSFAFDASPWNGLPRNASRMSTVSPDNVYLGADGVSKFRDLRLFVLGEGNTQWTNLKLAEAYARVISGRNIRATFLENRVGQAESWIDHPEPLTVTPANGGRPAIRLHSRPVRAAWTDFLEDWREAAHGGTLRPALENFESATVGQRGEYHFYAKTGTPQDEPAWIRSSLKTKPLWVDQGFFVFGITGEDNRQGRGIVGVVYLSRIQERKPGSETFGSSDAREFMTPEIYRKILSLSRDRFRP